MYSSPITSASTNIALWPALTGNSKVGSAFAASTQIAQPDYRVTLNSTPPVEIVYNKPVSSAYDEMVPQGMGAKLLKEFAAGTEEAQQAIAAYNQQAIAGYASYLSRDHDPKIISETILPDELKSIHEVNRNLNLKIQTASGKEVEISLLLYDPRSWRALNILSVSVQTNGNLTDAEQEAIANLASGFDKALGSISVAHLGHGTESLVDFSGLMSYDSTLLSGIDLSFQNNEIDPSFTNLERLKTLDFHIDAKQRSFSMETDTSKYSIKVDLSEPRQLGTESQRRDAVQQFLNRIDASNQRTHGIKERTDHFKSMFALLHSNYPASSTTQAKDPDESAPKNIYGLNEKDRAALTGLADFQASMSGTFYAPRIYRTKQDTYAGHIDYGSVNYQLSQSTQIVGKDKYKGLSVSQTQKSSLKADVIQSRNAEKLDIAVDQGNYDTYSVRDEDSVVTNFVYAKNKLKLAVVSNQFKLWQREAMLVNHEEETARETPQEKFTVQAISNLFDPLELQQT